MNLRKVMIAAGAILTIGAVAFTSCSKEKTEEKPETKSIINEFEWVGELHNEALWNIGVEFQEDLHWIVSNKEISENDILKFQSKVEDWTREQCSQMMGSEYDKFFKNWHLDMAKTAEGFMTDQMLNEILDKATSIKNLIMVVEEKEEEISLEMNSIADTAKLISLIVMRNSIEFWSDAYYNPENPWHELAYNYPIFSADTKGLPEIWGRAKQWVTDKVVPIVEVVVEAVCTVAALVVSDVWLFGECYPGFAFAGPVGAAVGAGLVAAAGSAVGGTLGYQGGSWLFNK